MVDQLVAVIKPLASAVPEQIIVVPKISWPPRFPRTVLLEPQKAEQLVEVPTILFFLKQTVGTRGGYGGLEGFHPGQGSLQRTGEQIFDTPVPGRGASGSLQGFHPGQGSLKRTVEQIVDIPVPGGELFLQVLGPQLLRQFLRESLFKEGFRTFPRIQKVRWLLLSTPRPQDDDFCIDEEDVWMRLDTGQWKLLGTESPAVAMTGGASDSVFRRRWFPVLGHLGVQ